MAYMNGIQIGDLDYMVYTFGNVIIDQMEIKSGYLNENMKIWSSKHNCWYIFRGNTVLGFGSQ